MATVIQIRHEFARKIGPFRAGTTTATTTTTLTEARSPMKSNVRSSRDLDGYYVMLPGLSADDKFRRVSSYAPTTGVITIDNALSADPSDTIPYELHGVLDPENFLTLLNSALYRIPAIAEVPFTILSNTDLRHSLLDVVPATTPTDWFYQIGMLQSNENRDEVNPYYRSNLGHIEKDGESLYFVSRRTFNIGDIIYFQVQVPASMVIGGTYDPLDSLTLANDSDSINLPLNLVTAAVILEAWENHAFELEPSAAASITPNIQIAQLNYNKELVRHFEPPEGRIHEIFAWGPRWRH